MANLALGLPPGEQAHRISKRNIRVYPVQLVQVDAFDAKLTQAVFQRLLQVSRTVVGGAAVVFWHGRAAARHAAIGGEHKPFFVGEKGIANQPLVLPRAIRIGRR